MVVGFFGYESRIFGVGVFLYLGLRFMELPITNYRIK